MLEHFTLLIHPWAWTMLPDGGAWVRVITDPAGQALGFVRYYKPPTLAWLFQLRKGRLEIFETDDASHLMTLTRSWGLFHAWDVHDAADLHVGSVAAHRLITSDHDTLGVLERDTVVDQSGAMLARFTERADRALEVRFATEGGVNPFARMLILGGVLALDAAPRR